MKRAKHLAMLVVAVFAVAMHARIAPCQSAERLRLANQVLDAMEFDQTYLSRVSGLLPFGRGGIVRATRDSASPDPLVAFYRKYAPPSVVHIKIARRYATVFDESELQQLAFFYSTPVGKKLITVSPDFDSEIQAVVLAASSQHQEEFRIAVFGAKPPAPVKPPE